MKAKWITGAIQLHELSYTSNLGFQEIMMFYQKATHNQIEELERVCKKADWESFKRLVHNVLGIQLH
jgi:hypothetical protein